MSIKLIFAWYDLWIGIYWNAQKRRLYILPVPCFGIMVQLKQSTPDPRPFASFDCAACGKAWKVAMEDFMSGAVHHCPFCKEPWSVVERV